MEYLSFPNHTVRERHPASSLQIKYGRGYQFASKPQGPDQLEFDLRFPTLVFFLIDDGVLDINSHPEINMGRLIDFYERHRMYESFLYAHPFRGDLVVKFNKPLDWASMLGGQGAVENFEISLILQP